MRWRVAGGVVLLLVFCLWRISWLVSSKCEIKTGSDADVSLARIRSPGAGDERGWLLDPVKAAAQAGLLGGARECISVHAGEIRPGGVRANHRHHFCNETFILWNARAVFRLEGEVAVVERGEVVVCTAASGKAHAITNIDSGRTLYLLACQDGVFDPEHPATEYNVWDKQQLTFTC